jgi:hypothetical protein
MQTTPMRAARLPGQSTLWTRTLDRLLRRMPERRRLPAPADDGAGPILLLPPPLPAADLEVSPAAEPPQAACMPVPRRTWTAPRHLPELLTDPRGDRRPARLALAR